MFYGKSGIYKRFQVEDVGKNFLIMSFIFFDILMPIVDEVKGGEWYDNGVYIGKIKSQKL